MTPDAVFSYWVLIWTIIYYFKLIDVPSPFYIIVIAVIGNLIMTMINIYKGANLSRILILWGLILVTKIYPAYLFGIPKNFDGLYFGFGLFIIYVFYINIAYGTSKLKNLIKDMTNEKYGPITMSCIKFIEKYT